MTIAIDQLSPGDSGKEYIVNELFEAARPSMAFGRHASACVGLNFAIYGGVAPVAGEPTEIADEVFLLSASATNYIRRNADGTFTVTTTAPTGWPGPLAADAVALYEVVTDTGSVTDYTDLRLAAGQMGRSGGVAITIRYQFSTTTTDADPGAGKLRLSSATQNASTVIRSDLADELGVTWTSVLDSMDDSSNPVKGQIRLEHAGDATKWLMFNLQSIATPSGYRNLTVDNIGSSSASPFAADDHILLTFTRSGDAGSAGSVTGTGFVTATSGAIDAAAKSATAATALLDAMVGDSGSGGTKGLAPAPASGAAAAFKYLKADATWAFLPCVIQLACSDETTAITTGTAKVTFRMPHAMTVTAVRASLSTASSSGTPTVDINEAGSSILSTKLTIDASELTSTTAATAAVISDAALADDAEITIDIDVAGTGAKGLKVSIIGTRA